METLTNQNNNLTNLGTINDKFRIEAILHEKSSALVAKARRMLSEEEVVVKIFMTSSFNDYWNEEEMTSLLIDHTRIVKAI